VGIAEFFVVVFEVVRMHVDDVEPRNKGEPGRSRDRAVFVGYLESRDACGMVEVEVTESRNFAHEENLKTEEQLR
jgi:hypothetical protein